jgi:hypothetical protein
MTMFKKKHSDIEIFVSRDRRIYIEYKKGYHRYYCVVAGTMYHTGYAATREGAEIAAAEEMKYRVAK